MMVLGVGLGFRDEIREELIAIEKSQAPKFVEFAPENWMNVGGVLGRALRAVADRYPIICHGLSLSLGSPEPLDWEFLKEIKAFLDRYEIDLYSEHLSYCKCDNAHIYDLLPVPFREEAVFHIGKRIREVQEFLERTIAIENISYYTPVAPELDEATFINAVLEEGQCHLLLDVNNVYVNSVNHRYDAKEFLSDLDLDKVAYIHMAGHERKSEKLIIDSHGHPISDSVFELFEWTVERLHPVPVLLERDSDFEDFPQIIGEVHELQRIVDAHWAKSYV
jgi:uncharacterized protein